MQAPGRGLIGLRDRLNAILPVEARWIVPPQDSRPFVCWPRPGPADPRSRLALEMMHTLQTLARQRRLRVDGADLELAWSVSTGPDRRRLRAWLSVASPEPAAHIRALGRALELQTRSAGTAVNAGIDVVLECHQVADDPALTPTHFW
jgi:hypothetical protein